MTNKVVWIGETLPDFVSDLWNTQYRDQLEEPMHIGDILAEIANPTVGEPRSYAPDHARISSTHRHRLTVGDLTAPQRPGEAIPHPTPTEPPSTPKNQNEATP